ncbi:MAG: caspase family protein, partial [Thermoplasmatales archaeon]|nr:caspase family protein [Thermoplasmatales archaeon]
MTKNVFRKSLVIGIIILFVGASVVPSISSVVTEKDKTKTYSSVNKADLQNGHSVPKVTDKSGNTKFHGLFIGTSKGNKDRYGGQADRMNDTLTGRPGWSGSNSTTLENESATKENITDKIEDLIDDAKPGDEVVIYFIGHGNNDHAKDGKQDPWEDDTDPKDEPDKYDNYIISSDGLIITDDELSTMISGFAKCVTITIIIDACYSGTFTDGTADLPAATNGEPGEVKYGADHLAVLTSGKGTTPDPNEPAKRKTFTDKIIEGLKKVGDTTEADKDKDGNTTSEELAKYVRTGINKIYAGDEDGDGLVDEDDVDYYRDPNTGEISFLLIDDDGDGLINEDGKPTNPISWYVQEYYVDDDAPPGGDGSIDHPFDTIQEAIDTAEDGDFVIVLPGIYNENLDVDKGIDIESVPDVSSSGLEYATIDGGGNGNTININADGVTISGFEIKGCGTFEEDAAINLLTDYCFIYGNNINDNGATGIYLHESANYNYIHSNTITDNDGAAVFIWQESNNNFIHHNNFINSDGWYNAKDKSDNIWDYGYPLGGNYWDDYTGSDTNGDGIGDTPYIILDGLNQDRYPFMDQAGWNEPPEKPEITGTTNGKVGEEYDYDFYLVADEHFEPGSEPFEEHVYCHVDWGDGTEEWIGLFNSGSSATLSHSWNVENTYTIQAKSYDTYGEESDLASLE